MLRIDLYLKHIPTTIESFVAGKVGAQNWLQRREKRQFELSKTTSVGWAWWHYERATIYGDQVLEDYER